VEVEPFCGRFVLRLGMACRVGRAILAPWEISPGQDGRATAAPQAPSPAALIHGPRDIFKAAIWLVPLDLPSRATAQIKLPNNIHKPKCVGEGTAPLLPMGNTIPLLLPRASTLL
jgi:hypothetical protein